MTPGGIDVVLQGTVSQEEPGFIPRLIRMHWPNCLVVDARSSEVVPDGRWAIGSELLVYRSSKRRVGGDLTEPFIHIIFEPAQITFVVGKEQAYIVYQIKAAILKHRDRKPVDSRYYCSLCHKWNGHETNCDFANQQNTGTMDITIKLTNLSVQTSGGTKLTDEEIRKLVHERITKAFAEEPFTNGAWVDRYTAEVEVSTDKEFDLLTYTVETLKSFDTAGRDRILNYLVSRFGGRK